MKVTQIVANTIRTFILLVIIIVPIVLLITNLESIQERINKNFTEQRRDDRSNHSSSYSDFFDRSRETETFGEYQYSDFDGKHFGIDYDLPEDTPVKAASDGKVTRTFNNKLGGKVVQVAESNGRYHQWYMHLNDFKVNVGDEVKAGEVIALSGNTGEQTTGAHLHFQRMKDGIGNDYAVNPKAFVESLPEGEESLFDY
ncbi:peptidase M23 [Staphylococcus succinus]|nr:peptidase M23 [Staphylococcus succinus]